MSATDVFSNSKLTVASSFPQSPNDKSPNDFLYVFVFLCLIYHP